MYNLLCKIALHGGIRLDLGFRECVRTPYWEERICSRMEDSQGKDIKD